NPWVGYEPALPWGPSPEHLHQVPPGRAQYEQRADQEVERNRGVRRLHLRHARLARAHELREPGLCDVLVEPPKHDPASKDSAQLDVSILCGRAGEGAGEER